MRVRFNELTILYAGVVELVDTTDSKSVAFERDGSSPSSGTIYRSPDSKELGLFYFKKISF